MLPFLLLFFSREKPRKKLLTNKGNTDKIGIIFIGPALCPGLFKNRKREEEFNAEHRV